MLQTENLPKLDPPGKGLPPVEAFFARHFVFPMATRHITRPQAILMLEELGQKALTLTKTLPASKRTERKLIKRFTGIEDSSRYWSVMMTLHHLLITGEAMASLTERLVKGENASDVVRIEDVKPPAAESADDSEKVLLQYEAFLGAYSGRMTALANFDFETPRHYHPWFGQITAHQWACLNAFHHRIHVTQIEKIRALL